MTEPGPSERDTILIEVHRRPNNRALLAALVMSVLAVAVTVVVYLRSPDAAPWYMQLLGSAFGGFIGGCLGVGIKPYALKRLLTYDSLSRTIRARDQWWGRWRAYPRSRFTRLEYSADSGRFYQVRADGRRRRVPVDRGEARREEWHRLVEQFHRDHSPGGSDSA